MTLEEILKYSLFHYQNLSIEVYEVLGLFLILACVRFIIFLLKRFFKKRVSVGKLDAGKSYAITQILSYVIWILAIVLSLDYMGVKVTVLIAGSTALFVGLGLGLQDVFKDFVAGFIILMERPIAMGDIIEIDNLVGRVREVNLRTTMVETRDDIYIIIPNQQLINQQVINWSHSKKDTRFSIDVGVAYGSDTRKVESLLIEAALKHEMVTSSPKPTVQFRDFGDSSLNFRLFFHSHNLFRIERTKSDIRFSIDQKFRENNISIPFPQRDIWLRNADNSKE